MESLLFWIFAFGMLASGLSVILNRNPVASALSLVLCMVFLGALFVLLNAFFLFAVQVLVYAGAVMVLFLFIIMLLDVKAEERRTFNVFYVSSGLAVALVLLILMMVGQHGIVTPTPGTSAQEALQQDNEVLSARSAILPAGPMLGDNNGASVEAIGKLLFSKYLLPFEVTSLLLLVATVGVILISRRERVLAVPAGTGAALAAAESARQASAAESIVATVPPSSQG